MKTILSAYVVANYPLDQVPALLARLDGPDARIGGGYVAFLTDAVNEHKLSLARRETWTAEADLARFSE